jgi:hypothetical protein
MLQVAGEAASDPDLLHAAPLTTPVRRLDEATAARKLRLTWSMGEPADATSPTAAAGDDTPAEHPTI